ncbi:MAG: VCBS domain-containing protein [Xanthobacteraceae bacterium]|nr:VCBS domain-containing protein [Xanthobacteraceae bacterium]
MSLTARFDDKDFSSASVSATGDQFHFGHSHHEGATGDVVTIPDAHLLFSGSYSRAGVDLVLTDANQKYVVHDYFRGEKHPTLSSPDGATLSPAIVDALTGHTAYAQDNAAPAAGQVIGHVLKLSGGASVIRNGVTVELGIGDAVMKGDVVQTGSNSSIGMTFIDGSAFGMTSNARMVLNDMVYSETGSANSSLISLVQGTITFVAGQTAKNGNMKVETPVATMGIRGTAVLVEIDSNDGPTKFSVLVEPDGHTGSYNLYNKITGELIGSVSQAGQVSLVSVLGDQSSLTTSQKSLADQTAEKAIIQQVFQLYFPNYTPDSSPKSNNRGDAGSSGNNLAQVNAGNIQAAASEGAPSLIQVKTPHTDPVTGITTYTFSFVQNTQAQFFTISETELQDGTSSGNPLGPNARGFFVKDHVVVVDPDTGAPLFADTVTPFVAGSGRITGVTGNIPTSVTVAFLEGLIQIDQSTGYVSFPHGAFDFLGVEQKLEFTLSFLSRSGPDTATQTLSFKVVGQNDVPVISGVSSATINEQNYHTHDHAHDIASGSLTLSDVDQNDSLTVTTAFGHFAYTDSEGHAVTPSGKVLSAIEALESKLAFTQSASANHGSVSWIFDAKDSALDFLGQGETLQLTYTVSVSDGHGGTTTQPVVVTLVGSNDSPFLKDVHAGTLTDTGEYNSFADLTGQLHGHEIDHGDQQALSYGVLEQGQLTNGSVDGQFGTLIVSANGDYTYKPNSAAINALQGGQYEDTFYIETKDSHGATDISKFVVNVTGFNDDPAVSGNLTASTHEGDGPFSTNLLSGASDVDAGSQLYVSNVSYQVDGSAPSSDAPTGLSLDGSTLHVDPQNPAFDHLAAGETETITVSYKIEDGNGGFALQHETITIAGINDSPVLNAVSAHESEGFSHFGLSHTFSFNGVFGSDIDSDNGGNYTLTLASSDGLLSLHGQHNDLDVDSGVHSLTLSGTLEDINNALSQGSNGFDYTVSSFETGTEKIAVTLTDSHDASGTVNFIFRQDALPLQPATLNGTSGHDVFVSSAGNDTMVSNGGRDTFVFNNHFGHDTIQGFDPTGDTISINGVVQSINDLIANSHMVGADTLITVPHDPFDSILLKGIQLHQPNSGMA